MFFRTGLSCAVLFFALNVSCGQSRSHSSPLKHFHSRITQSQSAQESSVITTLVAFGDSVAMGAVSIGDVDTHNVYPQKLKTLLEEKYPKAKFNIINSGIGGEKARDGIKRIKKDVIKHFPDLVIIGFALNDTRYGIGGIKGFKANLSSMISQIKKNTDADIVLLTANFMNTSDNSNIAEKHRKLGLAEELSARQNKGINKAYAHAVISIGKKHKVPVADVYKEWYKLSRLGIDTNQILANGLNHPIADAHWIPAELIFQMIKSDYKKVKTQELQIRLQKEKLRK